MKAKGNSRFDMDVLRDLAGDKVFARGEAYHRDGHVLLVSIEPDRVVAQVAGTEDYRTELTRRGKNIDGECSCPAFEDWSICKHMVATAFAANAAAADMEASGAGALVRIRKYLKQKGVDDLVDIVVELAERDPALFRKLDIATTAVDADDGTLELRLRKAIDSATRTRSFVDYRSARAWASGVNAVLDAIADIASHDRAALALKLVEQAIDRVGKAIASIDDSDGYCSALLDRACEIHLRAANTVRPDPIGLARGLFAREMADEHDAFHAAAARYAEVLGKRGLEEYRRLAAEAWEKLPPRKAGRKRDELEENHGKLAGIVDFFAERSGDVETRVALRAKNLSSPWDYLRLIEFCRELGREKEALRRAEEGLWMFEDGPADERLLFLTVDLLTKGGRKDDALAHLWRTFEKSPTFEVYARLRKLGGNAVRERAIEFLQRRLGKEKRSQWQHPADLLVRVLTHEKMYDAAWAAVRQHQVSLGMSEALARASEKSHTRAALEVYAARVEGLINGGSAYTDAVKLVAHMAALRSADEHSAYVAALKARHGRKRNLMRLLG